MRSGLPNALIVAIDGPAGSGKSTVARAVARALKLPYVDTGAMYRAATVAVLDFAKGLGNDDVSALDDATIAAVVADVTIEVGRDGSIWLNGRDVSREIRDDAATANVSKVSAVPKVREILVPLQRNLASSGGVVEGRDIGTTVFPGAKVKVFLTADIDERARRRAAERGTEPANAVGAALAVRDKRDSERAVSPLEPAPDAVLIDTTEMTVDEVVMEVVAVCREVGVLNESG